MKTTKNLIALMLVAALAIAGCQKAQVEDETSITENTDPVDGSAMDGGILDTLRYYVTKYVKPEGILTPDDASRYQYKGYVYVLPVQFFRMVGDTYGGVIATYEQYYSDFKKIGINSDNSRYDSLCVAHNDKVESRHHNLNVLTGGYAFIFPATYLRMTLDVVSDTDYDAAHPAGTSLADVINIHANSAKEFIDSGYDFRRELFTYNEELNRSIYPGDGYQLKMPLTQFNREHRNLLAYISLRFVSAPEDTSTHRFTITYRDESGRVFTTTTLPVTLQCKGSL